MSENSKIEWTDHTFNPFIGCTKVSPGCDHCYAEHMMDTRLHKVVWGPHGERVRTSAATWREPIRWNARHDQFFAAHGRRQRVFCASLADVFDNQVSDDWRADLFDLITATPNLDWLLLTKRIGNVAAMVPYDWTCPRRGWPSNVWLGATIVNQAEADRDIPKLLAVPARVRFLSMEPLLGPVDLERPMPGPDLDQGAGAKICQPWMIQSGIDWVIVGGESGRGARPMHGDWARSLRDQCAAAGVPFLFKQWGEWIAYRQHGAELSSSIGSPLHEWADGKHSVRLGKRAAGRHLDGRTHDEFPEAR
ncbi:phage Gp37/Gp68 family protein [Burkholderia cenocepacia]|uniref:Phage Gp37/Gp68 family protein n=1 Tax=Burkholderia cenocepacia TaxID=95486 RepID=A0A1V2W396_9BURK|nr:phage Gp37/Gp68 family protein [Burkholderia cenocepacia]MBR8248634.1 phage Gp37/Gp68 family protein [Burkholderia cenocepacia]MBR8288808.1 phage Gp37/Gp68 family protein [Burkholderia cenocepacia]MBR8498560.1 phage Gp37/Gp68 family protein [Burkholderia cenocepacia]ONJ13652.1 hypothetical protein A8D83_11825 [Burkholderia cenocepacia]ONJ30244.1 hypothetical protein A8D90_07385 [Burkholderia cenocepacia]